MAKDKTRLTGELTDTNSGTNTGDQSLAGYEQQSNKDVSGGYAGLTLLKINFKNVLNTFTSFFTNSNTAARTYTFQDRNGTIADDTDLGLKSDKSASAYTFGANNTNATANKTDQTFKDVAEQTYSGTIVWTASAAPSGTATHTYTWTQVGKAVTLRINLKYSVAGTSCTAVTMALPSDCPAPAVPSGFSGGDSNLLMMHGHITTSLSATTSTTVQRAFLRINSANTGYLLTVYSGGNIGAILVYAEVQYWAT